MQAAQSDHLRSDGLPVSKKMAKGINPPTRRKLTRSVVRFEVNAPRQLVWDKLTDFNQYAQIFRKRLQSCKITKTEGNLVFTESYLKPSFFVKEPCQHAINDLSAKPDELKWSVTDGNFRSVEGIWRLNPIDNGHCRLIYTIEVDAGPVIPRPFASLVLKMIQREVVSSIKSASEAAFMAAQTKGLENPRTTYQPATLNPPG